MVSKGGPFEVAAMTISLLQDVKTVSELKKNLKAIFEQLHRTGRPVIVTVNGKPDVVLLDAETFERRISALNLAPLLAEAEEDIRKGRSRPASEFIKELRRGSKTPR